MYDNYSCEPRRRMRRSSSTNNAVSLFSGLGELFSLCAVGSGAGPRTDDLLDAGFALPAAAEAAADASTDGANTSYADAL